MLNSASYGTVMFSSSPLASTNWSKGCPSQRGTSSCQLLQCQELPQCSGHASIFPYLLNFPKGCWNATFSSLFRRWFAIGWTAAACEHHWLPMSLSTGTEIFAELLHMSWTGCSSCGRKAAPAGVWFAFFPFFSEKTLSSIIWIHV